MGDEANNSSRKTDGSAPPRRENAFRLHYFPEIPLDEAPRRAAAAAPDFHRLVDRDGHAGTAAGAPGGSNPPDDTRVPREAENQAYREGLRRGQQEGYNAIRQPAAELFKNLSGLVADLTDLRQRVLREAENEIVELALAIARKVVQREIHIDRSCIVGVLQEALQKTEHQERVVIRMNSADLQYMENACIALPELENGCERINLEADDSVAAGGCVLETGCGDIDGRIEQRLQFLESALRSRLPQGGDGYEYEDSSAE